MEESRLSYLDNLRVALTVLVICHHANAAYGSPGGWYYIVREPGGVITEVLTTMFAAVTQAFFMSSFFLISAYFTAATFDNKGAWRFVRGRLIRLGIPLLVYYYVLSLVMRYMILSFRGRMDESFFAFFSGRFLDYGEPGPLWFTMTLMLFEGGYLLFRLLGKHFHLKPRTYAFPSDRTILLFILGIGLFTFFFRLLFPLTAHVFHMRLAFYPLYICMFAFGIIAYRSSWFRLLTAQQANRWYKISLLAIVLAPGFMILNEVLGYDAYKFWGGFSWQSFIYAVWEPFLCVGINMKLIVLFRDRFDYATAFTKSMAKSSYTAYISHAFFIVIATYLFTFFSLGRLPEILLMWPVAVIPCFLFADIVRRAPLLNKVL